MPIEDFKIGKVLGKGAFSSVLLVKRIQDNKTYAMKRVKIGQLSYKDKQNALNEIRILASLSHPNIIGYKEAFFDDITQTLNIVMEFADDGDIQSKIKNNQKKKLYFTEDTIWNLLIQILEGLNYLHENKIMHRDLKSANIFLNKEGIVKIGDLNVSKVTQFGFASTHTGTPYYASPEVWKDHPYDYKCDIWSVGVILYELCTLKVPFRGTNLKTLVKNINSGKYEPIPRNYSKELSLILSMMLVVNPNKRKSAKELLELNFVKEKNEGILLQTKQGHAMMMKTIKMPFNMRDINRALPKKRYNDNEKMKQNDEYEIMKESIREGGFGNFNFKELLNENHNNENNNINNIEGKKPIIVKRKNAIEDLYDKIFNRKNNNNNMNNNNFGNYYNNMNIQNYNRNLNIDYNKKNDNIVDNYKIDDINKENIKNKQINNIIVPDNNNNNQDINRNEKKLENIRKEFNNNFMNKENKIENIRKEIKNDFINKENKFENIRKEIKNDFINKENKFEKIRKEFKNDLMNNENKVDNIRKEKKNDLINKENKFENIRKEIKNDFMNNEYKVDNIRKENKDNFMNNENKVDNIRKDNKNDFIDNEYKIDKKDNKFDFIRNQYNQDNNKMENDDKILGQIDNQLNNYKKQLEDLRNKLYNKNINEGFNNQNNYNYYLNNNNNNQYNKHNFNYNYNFQNEVDVERKRQLFNKINQIKMNYNRNHNNSNKKYEQLFERNPKENNNKFIIHRYYRNDNNNFKNKNYEILDNNDYRNYENKYNYENNNRLNQLKKDLNNNIPIYNKLNYYNNNNNNILSNQDRIYQRPISANINYYHLNRGDIALNHYKEKYNINHRNSNENNQRNRSPLFGRQNYYNNERKIEYEKFDFNDYLRHNNRVNNININNNYYINNNQNNRRSPFKYQNYDIKKPYDFNNNFFS